MCFFVKLLLACLKKLWFFAVVIGPTPDLVVLRLLIRHWKTRAHWSLFWTLPVGSFQQSAQGTTFFSLSSVVQKLETQWCISMMIITSGLMFRLRASKLVSYRMSKISYDHLKDELSRQSTRRLWQCIFGRETFVEYIFYALLITVTRCASCVMSWSMSDL